MDYEMALLAPGSVFRFPAEVLDRRDLSKEQKIEMLGRWEYAANEDAVAAQEGMQSQRPLIVRRVILALEQLTGGDEGSISPTKQDRDQKPSSRWVFEVEQPPVCIVMRWFGRMALPTRWQSPRNTPQADGEVRGRQA